MASNATVNATIAAFTSNIDAHIKQSKAVVGSANYARHVTGFSSVPPAVGQIVSGRETSE